MGEDQGFGVSPVNFEASAEHPAERLSGLSWVHSRDPGWIQSWEPSEDRWYLNYLR